MKMIPSDFYCTQCGTKNIPIFRKQSAERKSGHLKKLFCLKCQKEVNCCEIKQFSKKYTYNDFLLEFNYNNFTEEGLRKEESIGKFKANLIEKGVDINE